MKRAITLVGVLLLAACGGGGNGPHYSSPLPPASANFTGFVKDQLTAPETADPADVSTTEFAFTDDTNETAFASVLPP